MAEQPGTAPERLQTGWYTVHQSSCSSSFALQRHLLGYGAGIESREQLGPVSYTHLTLPTILRV